MHTYFWLLGVGLLSLASCSPQGATDGSSSVIADNASDNTLDSIVAHSEILRKQGNALVQKGDIREAIAVYDKLLEIDPQNPLVYNGKAVAFDYSGNHLAAQDIYKAGLAFDPDSLIIKNNLAMSLILNHQLDQAIILLESIAHVKDPNVSALNIIRHNLALAYGVSGDQQKANKLNLHDLTEEQARENIEFYKNYIAKNSGEIKRARKIEEFLADEKNNIGFIRTPLKLTVYPYSDKVK